MLATKRYTRAIARAWLPGILLAGVKDNPIPKVVTRRIFQVPEVSTGGTLGKNSDK
jgi:hypothetical protein